MLQDTVRLYRNIQNEDFVISFPAQAGNEARQLIRQLLTHNQLHRLGCRVGAATDIKRHDWFSEYGFDELVAKQVTPPYVPPVKDGFDVSNFDDYDSVDVFAGAPYNYAANEWDKDI